LPGTGIQKSAMHCFKHRAFLQDSVKVDVDLPGADWLLQVYDPEIRRYQDTAKGVTAMIVVVAVIISGSWFSDHVMVKASATRRPHGLYRDGLDALSLQSNSFRAMLGKYMCHSFVCNQGPCS